MRLLPTLALVGILLLANGSAHAQNAPPPPRPPGAEELAARAIAAFDAHDEAELTKTARLVGSAWAATDALLVRGRGDVARAYAEASEDEDRTALLAYLDGLADQPDDTEARRAIANANAAFAMRDAEGALAALEGVRGPGLAGLWVLNGRATALRVLRRVGDASDTFAEAAAHAASVGCRRGAWRMYRTAAQVADEAGDIARSRAAQVQALALAEARPARDDLAATLIDLGITDEYAFDTAAAEEHYARGIDVAREIGHDAFLANGLTNLGRLLSAHRDLERAEPLLVEALALHRKVGNLVYAARAESALANVRSLRGDDAGAVAAWESAAASQEKAGDKAGQSATLGELALWHARCRRPAEALAAAERAVELVRTWPNPLTRAGAERALSTALQSAGRLDEAAEHLRSALAAFTAAGDLLGQCTSSRDLASICLDTGDYASGCEHARRSLELARRLGSRETIAQAATVLGNTLTRMGDTDAGLRLLTEALDHCAAAAAGGPSREHAQALANVGFVHLVRGEFGPALERTLAARAMAEELGETRLAGEFLANIGSVYTACGDVAHAVEVAHDALRAAETAGDEEAQAAAAINLGIALLTANDLDGARAQIEHGLSLAVRSGAGLWETNALGSLGAVAGAQGDDAAAEAWFEKALEKARELGAQREVATSLGRLATFARHRGDADLARARAEESVAVAAEVGDPGTVAATEVSYAAALLADGDLAAAVAHVRRSADAAVQMMRGVPQMVVAGDASYWDAIARIGVEAGLRAGDVATAFEFIERSRAGQLLEGLGGRDGLREGAVPTQLADEERARRAEMLSARARFDAARAAKDLKRAREAREALNTAETTYEEVVARVQLASRAGAAAVFPTPATPSDVRGVLADDEAFVAYAETEDDVLAVVLTRDAARLVDLGPTETLAALATPLTAATSKDATAKALADARAALLDVLALPPSVRRITVSPVTTLAFVPFAALDTSRSFAFVPSATTRVVLARGRAAPGKHVLALGDPDYAARGAGAAVGGPVALRGGTLAPLPASGDEAKAVGDVVLLGKDATESALVAKLAAEPRWHAVHFACHGLVDEQRPLRSSLAVTADANDDGLLSVLEIYRMQVASDLVVLSACESGRGRDAGPEGIVGFTGAFLLAGSDRVIASLWKVDDDATRALMTKFYEVWKAGNVTTAEALRLAQEHVRSQPQWADPRFWAAWQLWGLAD